MSELPTVSVDGEARALSGQATLNLTAFGIPTQPYPCQVRYDVIGRPKVVDIQLPYTAQSWNGLKNSPESVRGKFVTVALSNDRTLRAKVDMFSGWHGDRTATIWGQFHISDSVIAHAAPRDGDHWRIRLTNIRIPRGDRITRVANENGMQLLNGTIVFHVAEREWVLTDEWEQRWQGNPKPDTSKPLSSGRLETPFQPGDSREAIEAMVEEIEALLRVALCRGISWITCELIAGGDIVEVHHSSRWTKPFNVGGSQIISNDSPYQLKEFIETAHPRFVADREWFLVTMLLYTISRMGGHMEIRASLQNTLLDRMAAKVLHDDNTAEIDAYLSQRMTDEWQDRLHSLMLEASSHWTPERTTQLASSIKGWNASPSFPGGVERAATRLGLWPPRKAHLAKRHKLIHLGEYDDRKGPPILDYWREIECVVTMILLRMLGYSGPFYHYALGHSEKRLGDLLLGGKERPPYQTGQVGSNRVRSLTEIGAYRLWIERGKPLGDDWADWFVAEKNIQAVLIKIAASQTSMRQSEEDDNES